MPSSAPRDSAHELELARRIRDGDAAAFEALFTAHYEALLRYAFSYMKTRTLAEELVQDVFFTLWAQRERLEIQDTVRAYLYASTRNRALNWMRRRALEQEWARQVNTAGDPILPRRERADEYVHTAELSAAIRAAIDQLPPRSREAFVLSRHHHLTYEQIAEVMGISVKTVQEQIARALRALRARLAGWLE
jgi:RNA polymerase sigma-70 factor (ECF subfamily)